MLALTSSQPPEYLALWSVGVPVNLFTKLTIWRMGRSVGQREYLAYGSAHIYAAGVVEVALREVTGQPKE